MNRSKRRNGGQLYTVTNLLVTGRAWDQYRELNALDAKGSIKELADSLLGANVKRVSDGCDYYSLRAGPLYLIFCVQHGHDCASGRFALVTVKDNYRDRGGSATYAHSS